MIAGNEKGRPAMTTGTPLQTSAGAIRVSLPVEYTIPEGLTERSVAVFRQFLAGDGLVLLSIETLGVAEFLAQPDPVVTLDGATDEHQIDQFRDSAGACAEEPLCAGCGGDLMTLDARGFCAECRR